VVVIVALAAGLGAAIIQYGAIAEAVGVSLLALNSLLALPLKITAAPVLTFTFWPLAAVGGVLAQGASAVWHRLCRA